MVKKQKKTNKIKSPNLTPKPENLHSQPESRMNSCRMYPARRLTASQSFFVSDLVQSVWKPCVRRQCVADFGVLLPDFGLEVHGEGLGHKVYIWINDFAPPLLASRTAD